MVRQATGQPGERGTWNRIAAGVPDHQTVRFRCRQHPPATREHRIQSRRRQLGNAAERAVGQRVEERAAGFGAGTQGVRGKPEPQGAAGVGRAQVVRLGQQGTGRGNLLLRLRVALLPHRHDCGDDREAQGDSDCGQRSLQHLGPALLPAQFTGGLRLPRRQELSSQFGEFRLLCKFCRRLEPTSPEEEGHVTARGVPFFGGTFQLLPQQQGSGVFLDPLAQQGPGPQQCLV